jgi:hypothetical protein
MAAKKFDMASNAGPTAANAIPANKATRIDIGTTKGADVGGAQTKKASTDADITRSPKPNAERAKDLPSDRARQDANPDAPIRPKTTQAEMKNTMKPTRTGSGWPAYRSGR